MLFSSPVFIFAFLPIVAGLYFFLNSAGKEKLGKQWLVLASLFFYGYWNPVYIPLILGSILANFLLASSIIAPMRTKQAKRRLLIFGITSNLSLLGIYKYSVFFTSNINHLFKSDLPILDLVLPLAISFFTFQQIAYLVDCYQGKIHKQNLTQYSLFVCFFPQLIAGPIVHHKEMMPQFDTRENAFINHKNIMVGLIILSIGIFKKLAIADTFSAWADSGFDSEKPLSILEAWGATLSYTFQLYYDFSGYTDMAIGAALIFNIRLPQNFNSPYKALNIQDFWRRWHITLSHWLRDYLYIPLGGSKSGECNTYINIFVTFLLGGLWHGAGWGFVIWGALHGSALCIHRAWQKTNLKLNRLTAWGLTFLFVHISWVFFRAESLEQAILIISSMLDFDSFAVSAEFSDQISSVIGAPLIPLALQSSNTLFAAEWPIILGAVACLHTTLVRNTSQIQQNLLREESFTISRLILLSSLAGAAFTLILSSSSQVFLYFNF
jgi:alginate O-acetyltransferase complex protein AlgI